MPQGGSCLFSEKSPYGEWMLGYVSFLSTQRHFYLFILGFNIHIMNWGVKDGANGMMSMTEQTHNANTIDFITYLINY
jgi:hypothetical protein